MFINRASAGDLWTYLFKQIPPAAWLWTYSEDLAGNVHKSRREEKLMNALVQNYPKEVRIVKRFGPYRWEMFINRASAGDLWTYLFKQIPPAAWLWTYSEDLAGNVHKSRREEKLMNALVQKYSKEARIVKRFGPTRWNTNKRQQNLWLHAHFVAFYAPADRYSISSFRWFSMIWPTLEKVG